MLFGTRFKYIEAPSGADFEIRTLYKPPYTPPSLVQVDIMLDGNYVQVPLEEWGGKEECEGYKYGKASFIKKGQTSTRNFRFSALVTGKWHGGALMCL